MTNYPPTCYNESMKGGFIMAKRRKTFQKLDLESSLLNGQIAQIVKFKRTKRPGLPVIEINDETKSELVESLKQSLVMQALGYHVDNTNVTTYYDHKGQNVTNKLGVHTELTNERKYVQPNYKATLQLLETLDPGFFNSSGEGAPQIIDDWGLCIDGDSETHEDK